MGEREKKKWAEKDREKKRKQEFVEARSSLHQKIKNFLSSAKCLGRVRKDSTTTKKREESNEQDTRKGKPKCRLKGSAGVVGCMKQSGVPWSDEKVNAAIGGTEEKIGGWNSTKG